MIKHYRLREYPDSVVEVISVSDLASLGEGGFLILRLNSELSEDIANDIVEEIGIKEIPVPVIVSTAEMSVVEVLERADEEKDLALKDNESKCKK